MNNNNLKRALNALRQDIRVLIYLFIISLFYDNILLPFQLHAKKELIPKPIEA